MAGFREFLTGEVLTAANVNDFLMKQSVMVFVDGAARDSALGTAISPGNALLEGMLTYNKDTEALEVYDGTDFVSVGGAVKEKRIERFTGSGTFTVPAGVTYAIAHMMGGGGGVGEGGTGSQGGNSSVAFASGTVTGNGLARTSAPATIGLVQTAGRANTGQNASAQAVTAASGAAANNGSPGVFLVAAAAVTPAASITVTVGAGGAAGTGGAAGGSGYVYIEYYEEV